jgi:glucose-1-phosphate cytidylyltransferase
MKVVLFCGGQGLRLRDYAEALPKPMVPIGPRPVLWHVMRYYAHFGFKDFLLCLGYKADVIKDYFLRYNEALSNDFVLSEGGRSIELLRTDIQDWRITFVDTGLHASIGERLRAVRHELANEELFLANYADVLTDAPMDELVADFRARSATAAFLSVRPTYTFHVVESGADGLVAGIRHVTESDVWINGGHFIMRPSVFDYMEPGDELVEKPFERLIAAGGLMTYRYDGFWAPMDTLKDMHMLESMYEAGHPPWAKWKASDVAI